MSRSAIVGTVALVIAFRAVSADTDLKARVMNEYPSALADMESILSHCRGSAVHRSWKVPNPRASRPGDVNSKVDTARIQFERSGPMERAIREPVDGQQDWVYCVDGKSSFTLRRDRGKETYVLASLGADQDLRRTLKLRVDQFVDAPSRLFGSRISELMTDPRFTIRKVSAMGEENGPLFKIDFTHEDPRKLRRSGWFLVDPNRHWAVTKYECRCQQDGGHDFLDREEIEYTEPAPSRSLAVKRVVSEFSVYRDEFVFDDFAFGPVPASDFTLTAFGLPELGRPGARGNPTWTVLFLVLLAAVSAACAILLARAARRRAGDGEAPRGLESHASG